MDKYQQVFDFWFKELEPSQWFIKDESLDQIITTRFKDLHQQALNAELAHWREHPHGALAEIIMLDQFSRNIYRNQAQAFSADAMALVLAQVAIKRGFDVRLSTHERAFMYMPFMHSESPVIHEHAVELFSQSGLEQQLDFELKHKAIIDRFGRYPHRNQLLGRQSSAEELAFLDEPNSSF
ncbi:DUF924 family protein [Paraferrimonas haliotis]|uniref:DUF924 family protein n=1 Tax=Paraferrimonas haliotis TaxID=2013866 RepID=UPI000BA8FAF4|nr:DUF924 family protein [Paraferrimonas haliotis]